MQWNGLKVGWDIPIMMDIICPLPPVWNRVKVDAKSWLGRILKELSMFRRACLLRKQLCTNECKLSFFQEKNSTTCLELLEIFQAYT